MASSNIKAVILGGLHKVWELVLDIENYAAWRSDLSKTEVISNTQLKTAALRHLQLRLSSHTNDGNLIWKTAI